eukprot:2285077-Lingulodinium_polyedra.AAC.1
MMCAGRPEQVHSTGVLRVWTGKRVRSCSSLGCTTVACIVVHAWAVTDRPAAWLTTMRKRCSRKVISTPTVSPARSSTKVGPCVASTMGS